MPDFTITGNPGGIRSRAATTRSKAESFSSTGDALATITTDGWNSRAGDRFREKFDTEPERWRASGDGFITAANALENYADALDHAQSRARSAEREYARGDQVSRDAKAAYDADVSRARDKVHTAAAAGQVMTLTIIPFHDPGEAIRDGAVAELMSAKSDLESAAHSCASGVRAGCAAAPEKRKWYESVGAAVGGFLTGAGEALMDLGELANWLVNPIGALTLSLLEDAQSGMTAEEIAAKWELKGEDAQGMLDALQEDPLEFGKSLGKAMLDWDTWSDDPARALGHLLPDAIIAFFTAGSGTLATRGAKGGVDAIDALGGLSKLDDLAGLKHLDDLGDVKHLDDLDALDSLNRFDDVDLPPQGTHRGLDDPELGQWLDDTVAQHPELSRDGIEGVWDYTTDDGFTRMNAEMRDPGSVSDPGIQARIQRANEGLDQLPKYDGTTYRGTNLPQSVVDHIDGGGQLSDKAFSSSSLNPDVAENFIKHWKDNPTRITVEGHSGVNVQPFSAARGEAEILFRGGTKFDVLENYLGPDGIRQIVVREAR